MKVPLLFSLVLSVFASAQEEVVPKHMRFVALGEVPTWKEEIIDKVRVQQEYEPGQMPPYNIMVGVSGASSEHSNMLLRQFSRLFTFSGALERLKIEQGVGDDVTPWVDSPMPMASRTLGMLFRDHEEMSWLKPRLKIIRDDLTVFPLGTIRFVNLATLNMLVKIGEEEPLLVKAGESVVHPIAAGGARVQATAVVGGGEYRRIFDNKVTMLEGQRAQSFFYKAQTPPPALPVRFFVRPESFEVPTKVEENPETTKPAEADPQP